MAIKSKAEGEIKQKPLDVDAMFDTPVGEPYPLVKPEPIEPIASSGDNRGTWERSDSITALATALSKAQGEMRGAVKDSTNPFFRSKYADLASVVEAIREAFANNGLSYTQRVEPTDKNEVRVETIILHSSGEWISCGILNLPVSKNDAQGFGSALTYARRYGLSAAVGVAPEDDDGNAAAKAAPKGAIPCDSQK